MVYYQFLKEIRKMLQILLRQETRTLKKLLFGLLLEEINLEIMLDDHLVKNRALLDCKKSLFCQVAILEFFQRG